MATVLLLVVALVWVVIVDLTPADQRPYIGSSENNTVMDLITGHNGLARLLGHDTPSTGSNNSPDNQPAFPDGGTGVPAGGAPGGAGGGPDEIGDPGVWRLVTQPLDNEMGWWFVLALAAVPLVLLAERLRWPLSDRYLVLGLWSGWLLAGIVFFSKAEFFHAYYFVMLAPAVAALVGSGAWSLWTLLRDHPRAGLGIALLILGGTLALQLRIADGYTLDVDDWPPLEALLVWAVLTLVGGGAALIGGVFGQESRLVAAGLSVALAGVLLIPGVWGMWTTLDNAPNVHLPAAYAGEAGDRGEPELGPLTTALLHYVGPRTEDMEYLIAVPSSMIGAELVLATGRPVLYMGGFNGGDPVVSADDLAVLVAAGDLRYVLDDGSLSRQKPEIGAWLSDACTVVTAIELDMQALGGGMPNAPAGDGGPGGGRPPAGGPPGGGPPSGGPGMDAGSSLELYECG
ncbi:MAG: hypothetical protein K8S97_12985 [Anaerolineae bacterium]|nr:hypothetical protein [Anaerolineae bacterium]